MKPYPTVLESAIDYYKQTNSGLNIHLKPNSYIPGSFCLRQKTVIEGSKEPNYLHHKSVSGSNEPDSIEYINWMLINSGTEVTLKNMVIIGTIQVTAHSTLKAENCVFIPEPSRGFAIDIFGKSKGSFINCHFKNGNQNLVIVRDHSELKLKRCKFYENKEVSLVVFNRSVATIEDTSFQSSMSDQIFLSSQQSSTSTSNRPTRVGSTLSISAPQNETDISQIRRPNALTKRQSLQSYIKPITDSSPQQSLTDSCPPEISNNQNSNSLSPPTILIPPHPNVRNKISSVYIQISTVIPCFQKYLYIKQKRS